MKCIVTVDLEHRVWLEADVVVEVPDGVEVNEIGLSEALENQVLDLISAEELGLDVTDVEFPQYVRVSCVKRCDDLSRDPQIHLAAGGHGSLVANNIAK